MGKIRITERQAKLLGLKKLNETDGEGTTPDTGKRVALGPDLRRIVISGEPLNKEIIRNAVLKAILNRDKNSDAQYNELTNKIVSKKTDSNEFDAIKRNLKSINTGMTVEPKINSVGRSMEILANGLVVDTAPSALSPTGTSKLKITKEQYNRIFASGLIKEAIDPTDKQFKKDFSGADIKNLGEDNFKIQDKNPSLPSSIQGKFGKPLMETDEELKKETKDLIKYFYRKSDQFSPFWDKHGLTYDDIQDALKSRGLVVTENGMCELSKKFGTPEETIMAVENELRNLIGKNESLKTEGDGYLPAGAEYDRNAPWRDVDTTKPIVPKQSLFYVIAYNRESAILKGGDGSLYFFFYDGIDKDDFMPYAEVPRDYVGKDEDGEPEYEYGDFDIDDDVLTNYVNDNIGSLSKGEGVDAWESGVDLVKIDLPLKGELMKMYDKDKSFVKALSSINEAGESAFDMLARGVKKAATPVEKPTKTKEEVMDMAKKLAKLYKKPVEFYLEKLKAEYGIEETTGAASSGAFTGPMGVTKREMPVDANDLDVPVVGETTTAASSGQYTAPAFDMKSHTEFSNKKPKAFKKTQYAKGAMVGFDKGCVGYNNSKKAQKGGCSQGAVDNVVKLKATSGNVNAPSLSETANNKPKAN